MFVQCTYRFYGNLRTCKSKIDKNYFYIIFLEYIINRNIFIRVFRYHSTLVIQYLENNINEKEVDIYAPGYDIYATLPNEKIDYNQGTSMASPNAAGVAALLRSYFPKLTAEQTKNILLRQTT